MRSLADLIKLTVSQEYDGELNFATDCWTSPNHKAMVAFTVHLERDGVPIRMTLDVIELPKAHSGVNLALAFAELMEDLGIAEKVHGQIKSGREAHHALLDACRHG